MTDFSLDWEYGHLLRTKYGADRPAHYVGTSKDGQTLVFDVPERPGLTSIWTFGLDGKDPCNNDGLPRIVNAPAPNGEEEGK